jgi:hypothetical protein
MVAIAKREHICIVMGHGAGNSNEKKCEIILYYTEETAVCCFLPIV